jgi:hypothetical protein
VIWSLAACRGEVPLEEPVALTTAEAWELADDEPVDHSPPVVDCPPATWGPEDGTFEVQTGACDYLAVSQPLRADLWPGDRLLGFVWYAELDAAEPGEGHALVWVGEEVLWDLTVAIPAPAGVHEIDVVVDTLFPVGTPIGFHLHNHGFNAWDVDTFHRSPIPR